MGLNKQPVFDHLNIFEGSACGAIEEDHEIDARVLEL